MNLTEAILTNNPAATNKALKAIYENYFGKIKNYVLKNKGTDADARDIFQDGLMIFYDNVKARKYKEEASLETYLFAICRNVWLHRLQKDKRNQVLLNELPSEVSSDESEMNSGKINEVLHELKEDCRQILIEFYYHKKSIHELKMIMGMNSDQVVKNKKKRCLTYLMGIIKQKKLSKASFFDGKNIQ